MSLLVCESSLLYVVVVDTRLGLLVSKSSAIALLLYMVDFYMKTFLIDNTVYEFDLYITVSLYVRKYRIISLIARCNWVIPLSLLLLQHQLLIPGLLQSSVLKLIDPLLCSLIDPPFFFLKLVPLLFELHLEKESLHVGEYFFFINYLLCCIVGTFFLVCAAL